LEPSETKRAYSAAVTKNETAFYKDKVINEKLDNLLAVTIAKDELKSSIEKINKSISEISATIAINNMKLSYFIIDTIKILFPTVQMSNEKSKAIVESFNFHQLGSLESNNFQKYCNKHKTARERKNNTSDNIKVNDYYLPSVN
jgi:hypothetical protein